jgi:hypothetical protein
MQMAVGWIDTMYNNTAARWNLASVDSMHNGSFRDTDSEGRPIGPVLFTLDDGQLHGIADNRRYHADWCGIPWYWQGNHYKIITDTNGTKQVQFFQSQEGSSNWVFFQELESGRNIARIEVPKNVDYHCNLRFESDGIFLDVRNDDGSTADVQHQVYDETKYWMNVVVQLFGDAIKKAISA